MDIFDEMAAGLRPVPPQSIAPRKSRPTMQEQQLGYALAKQVPDLARGFSIATSYGDIVVEAGHHADAIAATVRRVLEIQLKAAELARRDADLDGAQA